MAVPQATSTVRGGASLGACPSNRSRRQPGGWGMASIGTPARRPVCGVARRRNTAAGMTPPRSLHPGRLRSGWLGSDLLGQAPKACSAPCGTPRAS